MPPHPYNFLKDSELTKEQKLKLRKVLEQRRQELQAAMKDVIEGLKVLIVSLDQDKAKAKKAVDRKLDTRKRKAKR